MEGLTPELLFQRGVVLHKKHFPNIDHGKFFVILAEDEDSCYGFFFVNSDINSYTQLRPALFNMQYPLKKSDYPAFLKHDSWVNCTNVNSFPKAKLIDEYNSGEVTYEDQLSDDDIDRIVESCNQSLLFSQKEKKSYFSK